MLDSDPKDKALLPAPQYAKPTAESDHGARSQYHTDEAVDVFVERPDHDIHYKTLSWQFVALLMIAEIVSNGMLSLPSALAVVGIVPAVILIVFLGIFGLFTAKLLIDFKLNHPNVHNMYSQQTPVQLITALMD